MAASGIWRRSMAEEEAKRSKSDSRAKRPIEGISQGIEAISRGRTRSSQRRSARGRRSVRALTERGLRGSSPSSSGALGPALHAAADSAARTPPRKPRREQPSGFTSLDGDTEEAAVLGADAEQVLLALEELGLLVLPHLAVDVDGAA